MSVGMADDGASISNHTPTNLSTLISNINIGKLTNIIAMIPRKITISSTNSMCR